MWQRWKSFADVIKAPNLWIWGNDPEWTWPDQVSPNRNWALLEVEEIRSMDISPVGLEWPNCHVVERPGDRERQAASRSWGLSCSCKELNSAKNQWAWKGTPSMRCIRWDSSPGGHHHFSLVGPEQRIQFSHAQISDLQKLWNNKGVF